MPFETASGKGVCGLLRSGAMPSWQQAGTSVISGTYHQHTSNSLLSLMWAWGVWVGIFISSGSVYAGPSQTFVFTCGPPEAITLLTGVWHCSVTSLTHYSTICSQHGDMNQISPFSEGPWGVLRHIRHVKISVCSFIKLALRGTHPLRVAIEWRTFNVGDFNFLYERVLIEKQILGF